MSEASVQPWPTSTQRLRLGDIEFDLRFRSIHRYGGVHELSQRCFDLLLLFLREPGVVHTREEIFRKVWAGVVVEDANITTSIWLLRKALGEDAKGWIRTVSKQGYVFDPPGAPEPAAAADMALAADTGLAEPAPAVAPAVEPPVAELRQTDPRPTAAPPLPAERTTGRLHLVLRATVGAALLLAVTLLALAFLPRGSGTVSRVVLVAPTDASLAVEARWPVELMHAWLDWQMRSLSDSIVVGDTQSDSKDSDNEVVVLLSVAMPAERNGEWQVSANFHGPHDDADIHRGSAPDKLVATIDEVSRKVMLQLLPQLPPRPPLLLNSPAAAELVRGLAAEQRRRWNEAVVSYRKVLENAPDFGFARVHLAQVLAELGQSNAAQAELNQADPWIARLPPGLRPALNAQSLAIRQDYVGAADAFGALWKNSAGERLDYRLAEATNLRKAGRSRDALERLAGLMPQAPSQALPWLIERAEIELANRDLARARETATDAIELARQLGWDHERAYAALLLMDVLYLSGMVVDDGLVNDAMAGFEASGDQIGVLRAQFYRELRQPFAGPRSVPEHLDPLLAEARGAGNVAVEIDTLRRLGLYYFRAGEIQESIVHFNQGLAIAESSGDLSLQRLIEVHLLRHEALSGDSGLVEKRLQRLRSDQLQGGLAFWVGLVTARHNFRRGEYDAALAAIAATEDQLRATEARSLPQIAAGLSCMRATVYAPQGRMADAGTALQGCRSPELPFFSKYADIGEAELEILAGNTVAARKLLDSVLVEIEHESIRPERWSLAVEIAPMLVQVGDLSRARALLVPLLSEIERSGQRVTEGDARSALAEIFLAEGKPDEALKQVKLADKLVSSDDWIGRRRLRALQILIDQNQGQGDKAMTELTALHDDAREHGDVLTELLSHSLIGSDTLPQLCSIERHARLMAQSGMRGANLAWLVPALRSPQAAFVRK